MQVVILRTFGEIGFYGPRLVNCFGFSGKELEAEQPHGVAWRHSVSLIRVRLLIAMIGMASIFDGRF
jgi:hypothetical protein